MCETIWGAHSGASLNCWRFFVQTLTVHPTLRLDLQEPILSCGNATQIFLDVLLPHIADGNLLTIAVHDGHAKQFLQQENALSMMAKCPVAEVCEERFRFIEPVVNWEIVFCSSTELPCAALCVLERVGHD